MNPRTQALHARWATLAAREKLMVAAAAGVIVLALAWWVLVGPALGTLRSADAQRRTVDAQLQRMTALKGQAQALQSQPKIAREEALRQLEQSVRQRLGPTGRVAVAGDRVTVTMGGASADALAQWLAQARTAARATPAEAHLTRNASGAWEGSVVLALPRP
jgi:general secretion pathway protein M